MEFKRFLTLLFLLAVAAQLFGCGGGGGGAAGSPTTYKVTGKVTYNGSGVGGLNLNISSTGSSKVAKTTDKVIGTTSTNADGDYSFDVPSGTYTVASADSSFSYSVPSFTVSSAAQSIAAKDVILTNTSVLQGSVSGVGSTDIVKIQIKSSGGITVTTSTLSDGTFSISLPSDTYTLTFVESKFVFNTQNVNVTGATTLNFSPEYPLLTIRGNITRDDTNPFTPLSGATVKLCRTAYTIAETFGAFGIVEGSLSNTPVVQEISTDANGNYEFTGVPSGIYTIIPTYPTDSGIIFKRQVGRGYLTNSGVITITYESNVYMFNPEPNGGNFTTEKISVSVNKTTPGEILHNSYIPPSVTAPSSIATDHVLVNLNFDASASSSAGY
jgi:hypothetical protein